MAGNNDVAGLWVRRYHPAPDARARLVCLPGIRETPDVYHRVSRAMTPSVDVVVVWYPHDGADNLATEIGEAMRSLASLPITLFGHGAGALIGFEVALRLERTGVVPEGLFVSGSRAPSTPVDGRLSCPLVALIGDSDRSSTVEEANLWRNHTTGPFELQVFSGGHFYLDSCLSTVINTITEHITS